MWQDFFVAIALVLVIEGMLPFLKPEAWRRTIGRIAGQPNNALRLMGLMSMLMGVALLYAVRQ
ncbi:MAG TPA: DUF2065 family protein [Gammaproteobacteria bacterium]|jgi:uncharacterized protein YjeT (DUF2065 family)|nr:DUF2065 family protein [Gammaproteobacteria bacterium]HQW57330.1 DUF2065 family protein [Gammaproteobacteria bacterium]HQZ87664.1 DUF2065 family protein [Gammaproteobacteria bacterium]HRA42968.1 DUF2065 family protein [Gammaproteobacteria bacterium]